MQADAGDVDGAEGAPSAAPVQQYSKLQRGLLDLTQKYSRLEGILGEERAKRVEAERELTFRGLELDGFVLDVRREKERCKYSKMSDEQFKDHVTAIKENYQFIGIGNALPSGEMPPHRTEATNGNERHLYSKEASKKALEFCTAEMNAGRDADYEAALEKFKDS